MSFASHTIIGFGAVGRALTHSLYACGEDIESIVTSRPDEVSNELRHSNNFRIDSSFYQGASDLPHFIWLTVPDDVIEAKLNEILSLSELNIPDDTTFIHCSGSKGLDVLLKAHENGFYCASLHPLQTFSKEVRDERSSTFSGIYASVLTGDERTKELFNQLCEKLEISMLHVSEREKKQIHLSAAIACNYLTTLLDIAQRQLPQNGNLSISIFEPLLKKTIEQNLLHGPSQALSGPVKRGDISTVKTHLELLNSVDVDIYKILGEKTLDIVPEMNSGHTSIQQIFRSRE